MVYTPPAMPPPDATAVMGRRITAWVLDLLVFFAVVMASFAAFAEYVDVPDGRDPAAVCDQLEADFPSEAASCLSFSDGDGGRVYVLSEDDAGAQTIVSFTYFAFFVVLQGLAGGSPGKLLMGLRVVDKMGERAGVGRSLGRTLLWIVDSAPYVLPLVGFIAGLTTPGHRRVGDLAAGTYVVRRQSVGAPVLPDVASPPPGQTAWGTPAPGAPPGPGPFGIPTGTPPPTPSPGAPLPSWSSTPDPIATDPIATDPTTTGPSEPAPIPDWTTPPDSTPPAWRPDSTTPGAAPAWEPPTAPPSAPAWEPPTAPAWEPPTAPTWDAPSMPDVADPVPEPIAAPIPEAIAEPTPQPMPEPVIEPEPEPNSTAGTDAGAVAFPPPQWDPARNTYLQWDPNRDAWLQWDDVGNRWKPIDT